MKPLRSRRRLIRATLQVSPRGNCLLAELGTIQCWRLAGQGSPADLLRETIRTLRTEGAAVPVAEQKTSQPSLISLRVVLPHGFCYLSQNTTTRWKSSIGELFAADLEQHCPMILEDLVSASLPLGLKSEFRAWTVAMERATLRQWTEAAAAADIRLEGIWCSAAAVVEYELERLSPEPMVWSDGRTSVSLTVGADDNSSALGADAIAIRVHVSEGDPCCSAPPEFCRVDHQERQPLPPEFYPALCVLRLQRIDPSESLNMLRDGESAPACPVQRQQPLARALWLAAAIVTVASVLNVARGIREENRAASATRQINALWHRSQGDRPIGPMPVDALTHQATTWRNLRERGLLGGYGKSQLLLLSRWVNALPRDVPVNIRHVRGAAGSVLIEGQARTQTEARQVLDALEKIPGVGSDSARTSPGSSGVVEFSIRLTSNQ